MARRVMLKGLTPPEQSDKIIFVKEILLKGVIISITFLAGLSLVDKNIICRIPHKKIYSFFIISAYVLIFWCIIYAYFV
ncbi:MAG: hypothetical protein KKA52_03255 [Candidatus Omnitrophica bacterium]|nr:hypothetical protein [Candidatus Omnitrophota bacterium]